MASGPAQAVKDQGGAKSCVRPGDEDFFGQSGKDGRKLCVRHKQMANQGVNAKLQTVSDDEQGVFRGSVSLCIAKGGRFGGLELEGSGA
jgi:hypothetical protein